MRASNLPSLVALRAFEAVGRFGVGEAATRLNVTRAAVLHQVRALEAELGVALFARTSRGLKLSLDGRDYLQQVMESFDSIAENSRRLRRAGEGRYLVIDSLTSFATEFIIPRLPRFYAKHPDVGVEIKTLTKWYGPLEFESTGANVAIRGGTVETRYPGLVVEKLAHELHTPVCSPALLEECHPLTTPEDLAHCQLLVTTTAPEGWEGWLELASKQGYDVGGINLGNARRFDLMSMTMDLAIAGQGVDLGRVPLIDHHLSAGRLVTPFDIVLMSKDAYWLMCKDRTAASEEFIAFRNWLFEELDALGRTLKPD